MLNRGERLDKCGTEQYFRFNIKNRFELSVYIFISLVYLIKFQINLDLLIYIWLVYFIKLQFELYVLYGNHLARNFCILS